MSDAILAQIETGETGGTGDDWTQRYQDAVMNTFGVPKRVLVRGEGCYVWDADGQRYLDLLGGLAVNSLGHAHPLVVSTVTSQLATLGHVSNFFASPPQVALAERLLELIGASGRVFFANSGTEANEALFKLARRTGRPTIVALDGGFHGRSMGALAMTGKSSIRDPFEPLPGGVRHVPFGDVAALEAAVDESTAAVVVEPIQGEAGVRPLPDDYLRAARGITSEHGALLAIDEVQTGVGRTGEWFAYQSAGITPDVVTVAKGLGSGFPVGACVALESTADLLGPGSHGTTFGGNPVAAAAGLAVLRAIERDDLLANVREVGDRLWWGITGLTHPLITGVRGRGMLLGIGLARPVADEVATAALDAGVILNAVTPETVRLAPPLILGLDHVEEFLGALPGILDRVAHAGESAR